jgi:hypothetical protein
LTTLGALESLGKALACGEEVLVRQRYQALERAAVALATGLAQLKGRRPRAPDSGKSIALQGPGAQD